MSIRQVRKVSVHIAAFVYILIQRLMFFQNIQKLLGFAPSRAVAKQGGSLFGPAVAGQQFK